MLNLKDAEVLIKKAIPGGKIQASVVYRNLYLFQVFTLNPGEETMDPFYSVNRQTGEVRDFSVLTDGDLSEITILFLAAKHKLGGVQ